MRELPGAIEIDITTPQAERRTTLRQEARQAATQIQSDSRSERMSTQDEVIPNLPRLVILVRDIDTGVRVTVRPERAGDLDTVKRGGHWLKEFWDGAQCAGQNPL
jgi:hypothetical protein